jgi:RNA polymerase sigma-70 factor (ECF subfamily)
MDPTSDTSRDEETHLLRRAADGDPAAWEELVSRYDPRLRRMIRLRLNRRLQGRADEADILQEA